MNFIVNVLPDPVNFGLQILATIFLFLILRHFLFKPVSEFLAKRKSIIENDLNEAKNKKEEALSLRRDYELKIQEAKGEAKAIIETSRKRGEGLREEIVLEAKKEAVAIADKARNDIEREKEKAIEDLKQEVVTVAMMAASKVIDKNLDENSHKDMINKFIDEVGESKWQN